MDPSSTNSGRAIDDRDDRAQAIVDDVIQLRARGECVADDEVIAAHPDLAELLVDKLQCLRLIEAAKKQMHGESNDGTGDLPQPRSDMTPPAADNDSVDSLSFAIRTDPSSVVDRLAKDDITLEIPKSIGRYEVQTVLGTGGFGQVFLAHDSQLDRQVAIKIPHARLIANAKDAELYLHEARTVAALDHSNIVPVYDVGSSRDVPFYVVSKHVDGADLASLLRERRLPSDRAAQLVATVADALHYAHKQGIVHRDVKPGNILIGDDGEPYVVDFGLALREDQFGQGAKYGGTPAYMSPEQSRGEGHRVDGRSDIFSLGVVLYESLVGRRPFVADTQAELLELVSILEPKPPRQIDDSVPKELERICLKALAKRSTDRYTTARDMADDLRHYLATALPSPQSAHAAHPAAEVITDRISRDSTTTPSATPTSDGHQIKVVPKGLRSFDAHDADFFMELLPGPRDRDGLPESLRFWKTRIEETDADDTFSVGLIYGPSGCGKSSLVKAGLLPCLSENVIAVYVEATAAETEARLLKALRRQIPGLPGDLALIESLAALRRGRFTDSGQKVLLVLDQFEQWLHAQRNDESTELVQALRHCDGGRLQCVVLVRDDFWMAATRFMRDLEIRLIEGQNSAAIDLFPIRHAEKVLAAFGRAFGALPYGSENLSREQKEFLRQAVSGLAQDGKVISVRLALFAEMIKGKPWTPATLKEVGGAEGVGVNFLEETFTASTAPPQHRLHQRAARAVLKALLPASGADIKGEMKPYEALLEASGYASRPQDFDDLVRILDSEIRLITPTDPEGKDDADSSTVPTGAKHYQLTHDYLVPSLRDWLTRKQKETRRGRAELLLVDRAAVWNARPESRQLPSLLQWFQIQWLTAKKDWTPPQRKMMLQAGRYHVLRGLAVAVVLAVLGWGGYETHGNLQAHALRDRLLDANTADVPTIVQDMTSYRRWLDPLLRRALREAGANAETRKQLHASIALLPVDASQTDYLHARLLDAKPHEVPVIRDALAPHQDALRDPLWAVVEAPDKGQESQRLRAAAALAQYDPQSEKWAKCGPLIVNDLVLESPVFLGQWSEVFRPVKNSLLPPLSEIFRDRRAELAGERSLATNLLADYATDQPQVLADLLMDANEKQFAVIFPVFREHRQQGLVVLSSEVLSSEIDKKLPPDLPSSDGRRETLAKRQANAAVALLRMNQPARVWPLLKHSPDPRTRSYLIHRLAPLGADPRAIIARYERERDVTILRALLLSLGEFNASQIPTNERDPFIETLLLTYRNAPDAGLHAAAEWLLRQWQVSLPPPGEPILTETQKQHVARLSANVEDIRQRRVALEKELPVRQTEWERKLRELPSALPASLSTGQVAHFPLDGPAGNTAANAVAGREDGTFAGADAAVWAEGLIGRGISLDGTGSHVDCGSTFQPDKEDAFSYGCWFRTADDGYQALIAKLDVAARRRGFDIVLVGNHRVEVNLRHELSTDEIKVAVPLDLADDAWHHVFVTYDGTSKASGVNIYVDGQPADMTVARDRLQGTIRCAAPLMIGRRSHEYYFRGTIDDVRIYGRLLADTEVQQIYEAGLRAIIEVPPESRSSVQQAYLAATYRSQDEPLQRSDSQLAAALKTLSDAYWDSARRWYVTGQGQTMVVLLGPVEFLMGSPPTEADRNEREIQHSRRIRRTFALAAKPVTMEQYRLFEEDYVVRATYSRMADLPAVGIDWYRAAKYCNWLSKQEGIDEDQWCYEIEPDELQREKIKLKTNYLSLTGYRLPTEAEMEYATRAGAVTSRYYGEMEELLPKYAWYTKNSQDLNWPVGRLKPNDFGLFDVHGNVWTWCQEKYRAYRPGVAASHDEEDDLSVIATNGRVLRGGTFSTPASNVRSAHRNNYVPSVRGYNVGFRLARTLPPVPFSSLPTPDEDGSNLAK